MNALARIDAEAATPSEICAVVETTTRKRKAKADAKPIFLSPSSSHTDDGHPSGVTHQTPAVVGSPYPGTNPAHHETIDAIVEVYRLRQDMIRARTKLILQAQASLRRVFAGDKDMAAKTYAEASKDPGHEYRGQIQPYLASLDILDDQQSAYEKELVRDVKRLPIYAWAKAIKGFGDLSLACIIGEASGYRNDTGEFYSVGDFKSVSALWKRMGLAVLNGHRQGNPGKGASADDWIAEGYSKTKRSVMWNIGNSLILSMGKFRPVFGEDVDANADYTELQRVFANRARYEAERLPHKCGSAVKQSATGKDSYTLHAANRAKRYTEKRLLRMLYAEWRRVMA
ncbi:MULTISPECIES: hypothetical protein [Shinella]|uniref:hypothetical protein n=1 Tax=Shinella TaxID=323620 RepID=UPI00106EFEF4|nr:MULTISPECIES: hypothetical protein [Shinella]MCD1264019.1 hypothetical protein [Shinella sumterensis]